jgi:recombination protein RecT
MATKDKNYLIQVNQGLTNSLEKQVDALPSDFNKQRFIQNCMTVMQDGQADFSKCEPNTVVRTLLKGAFLGLDFFSGECYAIPYGDKCQFQTDYKGEIKLAKKYSSNPIKDIYAKVVREGDEFEEYIENGIQTINFKPKTFNDGDIIGAFAVCLYKDGSMIYDTMSKADIEQTRKAFSKAANSKAWTNSYGEMCKKTVLRRLCKLIDLDFDSIEQRKAFEDGSAFDVKGDTQKEVTKGMDPFEEENIAETEVIDVEAVEVSEVTATESSQE